MPEIDNNQAANTGADNANGEGEKYSQAGADQGTDKNTDATKTGKEDAGAGEGGKGDDGKDTSKGNDNAKAPNKDTQKDDDEDDGAEPPVKPRLSKQDFIIGRQKAKIAKTAKADDDKGGDNGKGDDDGKDDDEVAPEDEALITKVVSKQFAPIIDKSLKADDDQEVSAFLSENPDFKPFEAKARRYMQHPSRRNLPIKSIFYEVAGDKLLKIGAERQKAADVKAKDSQTGGGSNRAGEGAKNDFDLSKEEFEAKQERIRRGQ